MSDVITQVGQILQQGQELLGNPAVAPVVKGLIDWMKGLFKNNKRAQQRLEMIERMEASEKEIEALKVSLDDLLYENEELKKQLEQKLAEVQNALQAAGINIQKTNTINITGDGNIALQDIQGGNINLNVSSGANDLLNNRTNPPGGPESGKSKS